MSYGGIIYRAHEKLMRKFNTDGGTIKRFFIVSSHANIHWITYKSCLIESENASTPYLDIQYGAISGKAIRPAIDEVFTIRPLAFLMRGRNVTVISMTPSKLTAKTSS